MQAQIHGQKLILLTLCLIIAFRAVAIAGEVTIVAASDLTFVFKDLTTRFQNTSGEAVKISYESSVTFAQIQNGAPFDLFFSADVTYPKKLETARLIEPGSFYEYATGKLVIWVPASSRIDSGACECCSVRMSERSRLLIRCTHPMAWRRLRLFLF